MIRCLIGLGGNFQGSLSAIERALFKIHETKDIFSLTSSRLYETSPVNVITKDPFLNAAASFETQLPLLKLFEKLEEIETSLGKTKKEKNASRLIDIDLLVYGDHKYKNDYVEVPHPRYQERLFVLAPLSDLIDTSSLMQNYKNINNERIVILSHQLPFYDKKSSCF